MRVLVVGSVTSPETDRSRSLRDEVTRRVSGGDEVEVVGHDPVSIAHWFLSSPPPLACLELARAARRFDLVVVQVEHGFPVRERAGRAERAVCLYALSLVLASRPGSTLRIFTLSDLPGGIGGRPASTLWRRAAKVVAGTEEARLGLEQVLSEMGVATPVTLDTAQPGAELETGEARSWWPERGDVSASSVLAVVRSNAARERQRSGSGETDVSGWELLPSRRSEVPQARPRRRRPGGGEPALDYGPVIAPGLAGIARHGLALADRHRLGRPVARAMRAARRSGIAVVRGGGSGR